MKRKGTFQGVALAATVLMTVGCANQPVVQRDTTSTPRVHQRSASISTPPRRGHNATEFSTAGTHKSALKLFGDVDSKKAARASSMSGSENLRQVTFASEGSDFDPELDRKGEWLLFASTRHREKSDIYMQRVDGTAVTQLTTDAGADLMPTFSPDGKRIAFASDRRGNWDIYIKNVSGGQAIQLTNDASHDLHPSFSPDGRQLIFCSLGAQSGQWELVVIDLDRPSKKRFIGFGLFPNWSPTGDRVVFQRARERGTRWFSVWTMDLENGEGTRPTELAASRNAAAITPHWSPDGKFIVFCTVMKGADEKTAEQADIWVTGADGRGRVNLTNSKFANVQPIWGSDGTIFYVTNRAGEGVENIWSVNPARAMAALKDAVGGAGVGIAAKKAGADQGAQPINEVGQAPGVPGNSSGANRTAVVPTP